MEKLSDIMDPRCIRLELTARGKEEAIEELVRLLAEAGKLDDTEMCVGEVMARERISSTGIGQSVAIPHRLIAGISSIMMAVGRKGGKGIPFDSIDGKPVHMIFLIIGPQGKNNEYLKILSKLSSYLNDKVFFEAMMTVKEADEVMKLIKNREQ